MLGDDPPTVSVPGEIVPGDEFYSYADKYEDDDAQLLVPAPLTDAQVAEAQLLALPGVRGVPVRGDGPGRPVPRPTAGFLVNEVNTIPGFTPISMYPRLWEVSGVPYAELLDRLIELAIARHERRAAGRAANDEPRGVVPLAVSERSYRFTTGQVKVRVMPSTAWICETTSLPRSSRVSASVRTITS